MSAGFYAPPFGAIFFPVRLAREGGYKSGGPLFDLLVVPARGPSCTMASPIQAFELQREQELRIEVDHSTSVDITVRQPPPRPAHVDGDPDSKQCIAVVTGDSRVLWFGDGTTAQVHDRGGIKARDLHLPRRLPPRDQREGEGGLRRQGHADDNL